jgi:hypothetical protein
MLPDISDYLVDMKIASPLPVPRLESLGLHMYSTEDILPKAILIPIRLFADSFSHHMCSGNCADGTGVADEGSSYVPKILLTLSSLTACPESLRSPREWSA